MQFSIFGVPFKCTKEMFTWEKIKGSVFAYWAQLWRGALVAVAAVLVVSALVFMPAFINPEDLAQFDNSNFDVKITMHLAYSLQYWYQQMFVPGIVLLCLWFAGTVMSFVYVQYYIIFQKRYRSFVRQFIKPEVRSCWSGGFWKPFLLVGVFSLLIGLSLGLLLGLTMLDESLIQLISWVAGLAMFHIFLHGGTWGFVPVSNQQSELAK